MSMRFTNLLSTEEVQRIDRAALEVLDATGCVIEHPEALALLQRDGAEVDFARNRACFPEEMVRTALGSATRRYQAAGRSSETSYDVFSGMDARFRCLGGALNWYSAINNEKRNITGADAKNMLALADGLPEIDLVGTPFCVEFPTRTYDVHSLRQALSRTSKHIWSLTLSSRNLRYQMALLETVCGGRKALQDHKRISGIVCINDPLKFPHDEIERLKIYGDYSVPVKWTTSSIIGGNAPYTVAGTLVQNVAQFLAGLVITQTMRPGNAMVHYITLQSMDMRRGHATFAGPELMLARAAIAQIARHYQLPSAITAINSAGTEKEQAMFLRSTGLMNCMLAGAGEINLVGSLDGGAFFSPEFAVIDNEIASYLRGFKAGFAVNPDTIGLEAISRGTEAGEYLSDAHTLEHLFTEKRLNSDLFDWRNHESWIEADPRSLLEKAREKALHIMAHHQVPPLEEKLEKELDTIVVAADKELLN